ncbi:MAG: ABC transporter substrate-binding protein [Terriglobales bacterium]
MRLIQLLLASILLVQAVTPVSAQPPTRLKPITIAQFGHVFLYMPLYVAVKKGFFKEQGLDVKLVSTGGDEKTFTAVVTGNAQFGVSDPTFTAIARERGQGGKVVAAVVRGVPFWVVTFRRDIHKIDDPSGFKGYRIATYTAPSTSYAVMKRVLQNHGKQVDAKIVQGAFGTLLALLKANQADMALDIEPIVSIATHDGAHIVYSPANVLGDFAFTGLTVSDDFLKKNADDVQKAVNALAKAMTYIREDYEGTVAVAKADFPEVSEPVVREALKRLIDQGTIPASPVLSENAWNRAIDLRKEIGDLKSSGSFAENVEMKFAAKAAQANKAKTQQK